MNARIAAVASALCAAALVAPAAVVVSPAAAAAAGWTSPQAVQPGVDPVLSFSPAGAALIGSSTTAHGRPSGTEIDLAPDGSRFAASPWTLAPARRGQVLAALALSSGGSVAAGFANPHAAAPVLARVARPAPSRFGAAQQLAAAGSAQPGQASPASVDLLATADGEIVGAGTDDAGRLFTASLTAPATSVDVAPGPRGLSATDDYDLATDTAGGAFLAGDGSNGCTHVAFRPAHRSFTQTYATGNCATDTPNVFDAITAGGHGQAALLSEDVSESGSQASRLLVQVGSDGRFGKAVELGGVLGAANVGLASDADGQLTAEWTACQAGPIVNGELSLTDCAIDAASGTFSHGFSPGAAAGTQLVSAGSGTLTALTADRAVAVSDCSAGTCSFDVYTATATGGFSAAHSLGSGRRLIALTSDDHGDLLAVWTSAQGRLEAATGSAASGMWSAPHALSSGAVTASTVTAKFGPKGTAIVAWSARNETYAARFSP